MLKRAAGIEVTNSLAKAAERFLRRQIDLEDASPFDAAPAARAEHAARLREAQVALWEGRPARMADAPRAAVREDIKRPLGARRVATLRLLAASGAFGNTMNFLEVGFPLIEKSMRHRETAKSPRE